MTSELDSSKCKAYLSRMRSEVRRLRADKGLSQAELGSAVGVSRQTINAIETERYEPSLGLAAKLARHFGLSIEEIFHVDET